MTIADTQAPLPTPDDIRQVLRGVIDPELGDDVVSLGMVRDTLIDANGQVTVHFALTIASCPLRSQLDNDVRIRVGSLPGVTAVKVQMAEMTADERSALMARARRKASDNAPTTRVPPTTRVLAIASGKGGVGKSSITANLAVALARRSLRIGVLDADIAGFSLPHLLGVDQRLVAEAGVIQPLRVPVDSGELQIVSMGLIEGSGEDSAVMLRGLMLNRALQHFLEDVAWDNLDYLLIDMPPGTSDVQMGLARMLPRSDMLVVTTPALAAQQVASRVVDMARRGYLRVAGVIENMSAYTCEDGKTHALFGSGGGQRLARRAGVPLLAQIPLDAAISANGDTGKPSGDGPFAELAARITEDVSPLVEMSGCTSRLLEAAVKALDEKQAN